MDEHERKGLVKPTEQEPVMKDTMSSLSVDSFAIHAALVVVVTAFSYVAANYLSSFHDKVQIPTFVTGFWAECSCELSRNKPKRHDTFVMEHLSTRLVSAPTT